MQPAQYYAILQHHVIAVDTLHLSLTGGHVTMRVTTPNAQGLVLTPEEFKIRDGAIVQPEPWLVQYIIDHPDEMQGLSPWDFQVLFTGLFERMQYRAWLGRKGADGGVDVFAEREGAFGPEGILVQCKHPRPGNKVGVEIVRLLHYEVIEEHATRGLVATDSSFTRNALQHITAYRFQMAGADGNKIRKLLKALRNDDPLAESSIASRPSQAPLGREQVRAPRPRGRASRPGTTRPPWCCRGLPETSAPRPRGPAARWRCGGGTLSRDPTGGGRGLLGAPSGSRRARQSLI